jgi:hypothetical protein
MVASETTEVSTVEATSTRRRRTASSVTELAVEAPSAWVAEEIADTPDARMDRAAETVRALNRR